MKTASFLANALTLVILAFCFCNSAAAQTALGDGRILDRNTAVGSGGYNQTNAPPNFRDRNLLITGDVVGGRGFRGSVGYTAESDFRGSLGSNDTFGFRANSALSNPQLFQNMQTYEQLRFGQDLGLVGLIEYRRSGSGDIASVNAQNPVVLPTYTDSGSRVRLDRRILDSSISLTQRQNIEPRVVGSTYSEDGKLLYYNASSVRGITLEPPSVSVGMIGLSSFDAARVREDVAAGAPRQTLGEAFQTKFDAKRVDEPISAEAQSTRITGEPSDHAKVLQQIANRYADRMNVDLEVAPELISGLSEEYKQLRDQLTGRTKEDKDPRSVDGLRDQPGIRRDERDEDETADTTVPPLSDSQTLPPPGTTMPSVPAPDTTVAPAPPGMPPVNDPNAPGAKAADFSAILRHGQQIENLSGATRDRFNELMKSAQTKLESGDYLTAEQWFSRALRFVPGHPLASAGAAHSQIGAGLYLSASLSLRNLLSTQPEMIDVRYAANLFPNQTRLDAAVARLNEHLQTAVRDRPNYAFLLAYIGHQTNQRELVQRGLDVMAEAEPDGRLEPILRDVWLAPAAESEK